MKQTPLSLRIYKAPTMSPQQEMTPSSHSGRKLILSAGFILVSILYVLTQRVYVPSRTAVTSPSTTPGKSYKEANEALLKTLAQISGSAPQLQPTAALPISKPASSTTFSPPMTTMPAPMMQKSIGKYADGSYVGSAADAYYGTVQVKAIVKNGQLADVQFLQYPNDRSNSRYINDQAMPLLTQEALQAQSAQVDGVSGATFTSQAFQQSLTAALALAKN